MRLTVLDLTRLLPGGYATHLLREMGARVIKVEDPIRGDYLRDFDFPLADGMSAYFHAINRGKESIALDLKRSPETLLKLAAHADVIMEGFRPGVVDRLGVGYEAVRQRNPKIIYCSLTGYGQEGGDRHRPGHDINYLSLSGLIDINRGQDARPAMPGLQIADLAAGSLFAVMRILGAVVERTETGQGRYLDIAMFDGTTSLLSSVAAPAAFHSRPITWADLLLNGQVACYNLYPTADNRWMSVGNLEPKFWQNFCDTAGREDWIPRQFDRTGEFRQEVSSLFRTKRQDEWVDVFKNKETCVEPVRTLGEAAGQGLFQYPDLPAPRLGEHTQKILKEFGL